MVRTLMYLPTVMADLWGQYSYLPFYVMQENGVHLFV